MLKRLHHNPYRCRDSEETRKFYEARSFTALEIFPELWNARNPALQLVKLLA